MFEEIYRLIEKYPKIVIHRHKNPDGDALGAQLGLRYILKDSFPNKEIYAVGDMTERYSFMLDTPLDEIEDTVYTDALAIVLDCSAKALISDERYTTAAATARIDHHIFVEKIAEAELTDTTYESCCGMIAELAIECGLSVSPAAARALYTGMVTDSGRFRYDSTTAKTFRLASFLTERDFDITEIYGNLYADELPLMQLRAKYVLKIQTTPEGVAYIYTPLEEAKSYGVSDFTLSRGMVGVMSDVRGIHTWVNFTESESGVLAELRSSRYNINPIAVKYGGGGHQKASGATLKNKEEAMAMLEDLKSLSEENNK
ncbi:MAG: bifunctional oligoribonuclease/PAP phosphatase NrnA [Clostridia bacterium]|nr:bifunctional oligoribonuclease/PAP phosphatase NrnA [Clostridia bacterium]